MRIKTNILIFSGVYLPGVRGGGPIRTISNLVSHLGDEFNFYIITSDRDLGDEQPYSTIELNQWNIQDNASVYYLNEAIKFTDLRKIINSVQYDVIYLNSFFNLKFTIKIIIMMKLFLIKKKPIIIAPRGELTKNALNIKSFKKKIFLVISRLFNIYNGLFWQASAQHEKEDIMCLLTEYKIPFNQIILCGNLPDFNIVDQPHGFDESIVKICFLGRIAEMKNLDFVLDVLGQVKAKIYFGIYGPKEDKDYWNLCKNLLSKLPSNITAKVFGEIPNTEVREVISNYDLFFVPSKGENYGHVFVESFSAGTPVLISDRTPWRDLENKGIGWDLSLENKDLFVKTIEKFSKLDLAKKLDMREKCLAFAISLINDESTLNANRKLFLDVV